ncbi:hypothetical protein BGY98DRAFT_755116 [Russula aff. rugulosa BPL654]|nr:hypothetical protein BGY98DRAFT_755116 [Russula aff. rugulosa BPL654]
MHGYGSARSASPNPDSIEGARQIVFSPCQLHYRISYCQVRGPRNGRDRHQTLLRKRGVQVGLKGLKVTILSSDEERRESLGSSFWRMMGVTHAGLRTISRTQTQVALAQSQGARGMGMGSPRCETCSTGNVETTTASSSPSGDSPVSAVSPTSAVPAPRLYTVRSHAIQLPEVAANAPRRPNTVSPTSGSLTEMRPR